MLFIILYNCCMLAFYILFDADVPELFTFDILVEVFFGLDMIMRFLHAYRDETSLEVVNDLKKIALRYLKY